jgi:hypothetical protein
MSPYQIWDEVYQYVNNIVRIKQRAHPDEDCLVTGIPFRPSNCTRIPDWESWVIDHTANMHNIPSELRGNCEHICADRALFNDFLRKRIDELPSYHKVYFVDTDHVLDNSNYLESYAVDRWHFKPRGMSCFMHMCGIKLQKIYLPPNE